MTSQAVSKKTSSKEKFSYGDQVKVHFKIKEGDNERIQVYEGVVIRVKGSGDSRTFTVRKTSFGVGVERIFPLHSPLIEKIEIVKSGKVRRAKLYYLRDLAGKSARIEEGKAAASDDAAAPVSGGQTPAASSSDENSAPPAQEKK